MLGLHFIKAQLMDVKWGRFYNNLFDTRQEGDHSDFMLLTKEEILPILAEVEVFRKVISNLLGEGTMIDKDTLNKF